MLLEIDNLVSGYGRSQVLNGLSIAVEAGERVAVVGRNGMGKSTFAKAVSGLLPTWSGTVSVDGEVLSKLPAHRRTWAGVGYVPQGRALFPRLTVEQNLLVGLQGSRPRGRRIPDTVLDAFPILRSRLTQTAGTLSGGEQQQLAIARCLVGRPKVLILDEPSEGIQPNLVELIMDRLKQLAQDSGLGVVLIEQNMDAALRFAERYVVVQKGAVRHAGPIEELRDEELVHGFLGV
ncbi:MAG: ABC transporter ATP-binding protein [Pseudolysinimonas sp.]